MSNVRKVVLIILFVVVFLFASIYILWLIAKNATLDEARKATSIETEWFTSHSPDGKNNVKVMLVGDTFTFGSQNISVYVNGKYLLKTHLSNDGKELKDENYGVIWQSNDKVILKFNGEEMPDVQYLIDLNGDEIIYEETIFTESIAKFT